MEPGWMVLMYGLVAVSAVTGARMQRSPNGMSSSSSSSSTTNNGYTTTTNSHYNSGGLGLRSGFDGSPGAGSYAASGPGSYAASGPGSFAAAGPYAGAGPAGFGPAAAFGGGAQGFYFPFQQPFAPYDFNALFQQYIAQMAAGPQGFNPQAGFPSPDNSIGGENYGPNGASASATFGPQGGYGQANVGDGIGLRFGGEFPAPSGGSGTYGTFSSSSSSSSDVNGKRTSMNTATVGATDGEKIYFKTVSNPPS